MLREEDRPVTTPPYRVVNAYNFNENFVEGPRIKVRCIAPEGLYYGGVFMRCREGDVFELIPQRVGVFDEKTGRAKKEKGKLVTRIVTAEEQFSDETMERVEDDEPQHITTAKEEILKKNEELRPKK